MANLLKSVMVALSMMVAPVSSVVANDLSEQGIYLTEFETRGGIQDFIHGLYIGHRFSELEFLHERFQNPAERTASGMWKLIIFHNSINLPRTMQPGFYSSEGEIDDVFLGKWLMAFPQSQAAHMARTRFYLDAALLHYDAYLANPHVKDYMRVFRENIGSAISYMKKHRSPQSSDPHWDELALKLAGWSGMEPLAFKNLLSTALDRNPGYYRLYFTAIDHYIRHDETPIESIESLAFDAVRRTKAFEGTALHARIYWYLLQQYATTEVLDAAKVKWPAIQSAFADMRRKYNDEWNINAEAQFACWAKDKKATAKLMSQITHRVERLVWFRDEAFDACLAFAGMPKRIVWPVKYTKEKPCILGRPETCR